VILAAPRTGSNLLCTLLNSHPDVLCHHELQHVWQATEGASSVGFKMTRGQNETVMRSLVEDSSILKILLYRKNRLKTFVSEQIARQIGQWEAYTGDELTTQTPRINVDVRSLKAHVDANRCFYEGIQQLLQLKQQSWIELFYENIFVESEHKRLLEFLGVESTEAGLTHSSIKQNAPDLRNLIEKAELYDCGN
jgi:LPS sulfotransferase NodH